MEVLRCLGVVSSGDCVLVLVALLLVIFEIRLGVVSCNVVMLSLMLLSPSK